MLKTIPSLLSPELLKILMEMGHGDEIVVADANFPAAANARRLIRCDGSNAVEVLSAIMQLFPLDTFTSTPAAVMEVVAGDRYSPSIWPKFHAVIRQYEPWFQEFEKVERNDFYLRSRQAYAVIATGENERYANIILRKGIIEMEPVV